MEPTTVSPFAIADTYRIGLHEGLKSGIVAGVIGTLLVQAVRRSRKKGEPSKFWSQFQK